MIQAILDVQKEAESHLFENELHLRFNEMEHGAGITLSIDQLEERARSVHKKRIQAEK